MKLQYVATEEQIVDVLTKPLAKVKFDIRGILGSKMGLLRKIIK